MMQPEIPASMADSLYGSEGSISTPSSPQAADSSAATSFSNDFSIGRPGTSSSFDSSRDGESDRDSPLDKDDGRVILRMEVSRCDHSYLIGSGGSKVQAIKEMYGCHVHYPDATGLRTIKSSQTEAAPGKSATSYPVLLENEVSVRGRLASAIAGFNEVRRSIPFSFTFVVQSVLGSSEYLQQGLAQMERQFLIEVKMKQAERGSGIQFTIRGPQVARTLVGADLVCSFLAPHLVSGTHQVSQTISISPQSQSQMFDLADAVAILGNLAQQTRVHVAFPNPSGNNGDKETVILTGTIRNVAAAWIIVMSLLPVTLRVYISRQVHVQQLEGYMKIAYGVSFYPPKKETVEFPYVELKTNEGNIANLCKAYHHIVPSSAPRALTVAVEDRLDELGLSGYRIFAPPPHRSSLVERPPVSHGGQRKPKYVLSVESPVAPVDYSRFSRAMPPASHPFAFPGQSPHPAATSAFSQAQLENLYAWQRAAVLHQIRPTLPPPVNPYKLTLSPVSSRPRPAPLTLRDFKQDGISSLSAPARPKAASPPEKCQCSCSGDCQPKLPEVQLSGEVFFPVDGPLLSSPDAPGPHGFWNLTAADRNKQQDIAWLESYLKSAPPSSPLHFHAQQPFISNTYRPVMQPLPDFSLEQMIREAYDPTRFVADIMKLAMDQPPTPSYDQSGFLRM